MPYAFGHTMLEHWWLEPSITYLNHGTVGAVPKRVLAAQQAIQREIEGQPARYLLRELAGTSGVSKLSQPRLRVAADKIAAFVGAKGEDLVFVNNATTGVNAVLRSMRFEPGDEILLTDLTYGAIEYTAQFVARQFGAKVVRLETPFPTPDPQVYVDVIAKAITPRTKLLIIDHIASESALILPLKEIAAVCHAKGITVLVDGAHAPGAIHLDLPSLGVDYYTGNLHKWAMSPRSCAILWASPERQTGLHPTVISWGLDQGFSREFDWVGTYDPSAYLAAPEGVAFMEDMGLEAMRTHNHNLAWQAVQLLTKRWETHLETPESMVGCMVTIPLPKHAGSSREDAASLKDALLFEDNIEAPILSIKNHLWVRISAQVYNEIGDIEKLADSVSKRLD